MTGILFGCFDLFHPGHIYFIENVLKINNQLTVVVTRDNIIKLLKKREPIQSEDKRIENIKRRFPNVNVILGDKELGKYKVIRKINPDTLFFGYDQESFKKHFTDTFPLMKIITIDAFEPDKWSTTILSSKENLNLNLVLK